MSKPNLAAIAKTIAAAQGNAAQGIAPDYFRAPYGKAEVNAWPLLHERGARRIQGGMGESLRTVVRARGSA